jgi:hypothetical protein
MGPGRFDRSTSANFEGRPQAVDHQVVCQAAVLHPGGPAPGARARRRGRRAEAVIDAVLVRSNSMAPAGVRTGRLERPRELLGGDVDDEVVGLRLGPPGEVEEGCGRQGEEADHDEPPTRARFARAARHQSSTTAGASSARPAAAPRGRLRTQPQSRSQATAQSCSSRSAPSRHRLPSEAADSRTPMSRRSLRREVETSDGAIIGFPQRDPHSRRRLDVGARPRSVLPAEARSRET